MQGQYRTYTSTVKKKKKAHPLYTLTSMSKNDCITFLLYSKLKSKSTWKCFTTCVQSLFFKWLLSSASVHTKEHLMQKGYYLLAPSVRDSFLLNPAQNFGLSLSWDISGRHKFNILRAKSRQSVQALFEYNIQSLNVAYSSLFSQSRTTQVSSSN